MSSALNRIASRTPPAAPAVGNRSKREGAKRRQPLLMQAAVKPLVFVAGGLPFAWLLTTAVLAATGQSHALGANPAEALIRSTGDWTLRLLCLTLAITPLRQLLHQPALARLRRMLGLYTFFYGCVHFLCYGWLDMGLVWDDIVRDIVKRPFILVGSTALLLMLPLAATSFNRAIRSLGARRWQWLHRAIYPVAGLALLHFFWMRSAKSNYAEVAVYAAVIGTMLGWRMVHALRARAALRRTAGDGTTGIADIAGNGCRK